MIELTEIEYSPAVAVVRLRRGIVGESRRVCHVVPIPEGDTTPSYLTALCGVRIYPGQGEVLGAFTGMPCDSCVVASMTAGSTSQMLPPEDVEQARIATVPCC
jgi:hypothetical protein